MCLSLLRVPGEVVLGVFGHGGCIRALLHHYCGLHDAFTWLVTQDNTAMNELLLDGRGVATIRINDASHLHYTMAAPTVLLQEAVIDSIATDEGEDGELQSAEPNK